MEQGRGRRVQDPQWERVSNPLDATMTYGVWRKRPSGKHAARPTESTPAPPLPKSSGSTEGSQSSGPGEKNRFWAKALGWA
jgi:hypothetical protein